MKNGSLIIAAMAVMALSSCYVEVQGGHPNRHPFWHHRGGASLEIRGQNNANQKDSLQSSVSGAVNEPDSLAAPLVTDTIAK